MGMLKDMGHREKIGLALIAAATTVFWPLGT